jgi:hypothetical protein
MAMMDEVESGNVKVCLIKDSSRLGRDYLRVGLIMEKLREKGVRLIAINDNLDTAKGEDEFMPFRNIIHEWYVRDTSKKIRSVFQAKGMSGKHTASTTPYGYLKSPDDKNIWIVDEEAAEIVRRIFKLTMDGEGPYRIARILEADKVLIPAAHMALHGAGLHQKVTFDNPYNWSSGTVCSILKKKEYLGHTCNFKTRKHFKDKKSHYVPEDEWTIFENTHPAIIDQETFDNVQRIRSNVKRRPDGWGYVHPLTGLLYCADCGGKLHVHRMDNNKPIPKYTCANYGKVPVGTQCKSAHRIDATSLLELVRQTLRDIAKYAHDDKDAFKKSVQEALSAKQTDEVKQQKKRLVQCKRRVVELDTLTRRIYEDFALGRLSEKRYQALSSDYEKENAELEIEISKLQSAVDAFSDGSARAEKFMALVKRYDDFDELTNSALNEFVEKIIVYERDRKGCTETTQRVDIYLNFIGEFKAPLEAIDPEELAQREEAERKKRERQEKLHQNYLERKATGKCKEYDREYGKRRRARLKAQKEARIAAGDPTGPQPPVRKPAELVTE